MQFKKNIKGKYTIHSLFHDQGVLNELIVKEDVSALEKAMESFGFEYAFDTYGENIKNVLNELFEASALMKIFFDEAQKRGLIYDV